MITKGITIAAVCLSLAGCDAQHAVDHATYVCKDGVEYFVYEKYNGRSYNYSIVPHFKLDGSLYPCSK